jgi:archaellum component FlaC
METNEKKNPITDHVVNARDEEINRLREENDQLRKENEQLTNDLSLYKSLYNTVTEQNKSLSARIEAIKNILEI